MQKVPSEGVGRCFLSRDDSIREGRRRRALGKYSGVTENLAVDLGRDRAHAASRKYSFGSRKTEAFPVRHREQDAGAIQSPEGVIGDLAQNLDALHNPPLASEVHDYGDMFCFMPHKGERQGSTTAAKFCGGADREVRPLVPGGGPHERQVDLRPRREG